MFSKIYIQINEYIKINDIKYLHSVWFTNVKPMNWSALPRVIVHSDGSWTVKVVPDKNSPWSWRDLGSLDKSASGVSPVEDLSELVDCNTIHRVNEVGDEVLGVTAGRRVQTLTVVDLVCSDVRPEHTTCTQIHRQTTLCNCTRGIWLANKKYFRLWPI